MSPTSPEPIELTIPEIQGQGFFSPHAGRDVITEGQVTGATRKGFFVQDSRGEEPSSISRGLFVYSRRERPAKGAWLRLQGRVLDYRTDENDRPTTQLDLDAWELVSSENDLPAPIWLRSESLPRDSSALVHYLNSLEGMLVGIEAGATLIAPSNPFGDYVVVPHDSDEDRTRHGGVRIDPLDPQRWFPGFRITDYRRAPVVHVGAELRSTVIGPLNYRSSSYQIAATGPIDVDNPKIEVERARLLSGAERLTVLTLNGFNLDPKVEDPRKVADRSRDVDDDVGAGRFLALGRAIVDQAGSPDVIALQEIQDDDGAEQTHVVRARRTYRELISAIRRAGGPRYVEIDRSPEAGADGGQPGGNIRNGFLYDPLRVEPVPGSIRRLGTEELSFEDSRKVLQAGFMHRETRESLWVLNVHLASKRHQRSLFAPEQPGEDPRAELRVEQARFVRDELRRLAEKQQRYYVTGDFNDFEFSNTLGVLEGSENYNLARQVPRPERYDYNHRGRLQVLMHGVVSRADAESGRAHYEILHGNELIGVQPGDLGEKPTDHGYVLAAFDLT